MSSPACHARDRCKGCLTLSAQQKTGHDRQPVLLQGTKLAGMPKPTKDCQAYSDRLL